MAVWSAVLLLITTQATFLGAVDSIGVFFGLLVGCYTMAAYSPLLTAVAGLLALAPVLAYSNWRSSGDPLEDLVFIVLLVDGFWVAGRLVWSRDQLVRRLAQQAQELERARAAEARRWSPNSALPHPGQPSPRPVDGTGATGSRVPDFD